MSQSKSWLELSAQAQADSQIGLGQTQPMKHKFLNDRAISAQANQALESLITEDKWLIEQEKAIIRDCATVFAKASWLSMYLGLKLRGRSPAMAVAAQDAAMALLRLQEAFEAES